MDSQPQLLPILREGIDVVKMVLFKRLKTRLAEKHPDFTPLFINKLAGAMLNDLFGSHNVAEPHATFAANNKPLIDGELACLAEEFEDLKIPLTDALRVQFLCDAQEGVDSSHVLVRANELRILIPDREAPLPARFVALIRRLGAALDLLASSSPPTEAPVSCH